MERKNNIEADCITDLEKELQRLKQDIKQKYSSLLSE